MFTKLRNRAGRRLREPFGKAGLTVAVIALVFAMLGGAYAAVGLNSKQKKEVKSIAKSFQGTGPAGAQGPAGAKGDTGAQGPKGDTGATGPQGPQGLKGAAGAPGKEGDPWTAGGTLPAGAMETGTWGVAASYPELANVIVPISFTIPLSEADAAVINEEESFELVNIHVLEVGEDETTDCPGTAENPEAASGNLCVFSAARSGLFFANHFLVVPPSGTASLGSKFGVDRSGTYLYSRSAEGPGPEPQDTTVFATGTWALTAPE